MNQEENEYDTTFCSSVGENYTKKPGKSHRAVLRPLIIAGIGLSLVASGSIGTKHGINVMSNALEDEHSIVASVIDTDQYKEFAENMYRENYEEFKTKDRNTNFLEDFATKASPEKFISSTEGFESENEKYQESDSKYGIAMMSTVGSIMGILFGSLSLIYSGFEAVVSLLTRKLKKESENEQSLDDENELTK